MAKAFAKLPSSVQTAPEPFEVSIPQTQIDEFKELLKLSKIGPTTYETEQSDQRFGITRDWLLNAKKEWENWDWRKVEERINSFPNYTISLKEENDDFTVHFAALFSYKQDAVPLLFLHGWPGNFMEFLGILQILTEKYTPETLPYHVIVPSLPGYAFSSPAPLGRDFAVKNVANLMNSLMENLGFAKGYVVQAGDWGSRVARILALEFDSVKLIHLNFWIVFNPLDGIREEDYNSKEKEGLKRREDFQQFGRSYAMQHATKPSTIGLILASNPIALLTWIGEKFLSWTDQDPPLDEIFASVTLYWLTETFPRSIYPYRGDPKKFPSQYIEKPLGFSWFPKELMPVPKAWVEKAGNLVNYREHESGGHFAALEKPELLLEDVELFIKENWKV